MTLGVDIYDAYQDLPDPKAFDDSPYGNYAYVKGTDGGSTARFPPDAFVGLLHARGIPCGLYHYAQLSPTPEAQARVLAAKVNALNARGLPPALDLEDPFPAAWSSRDFAVRFLRELRRLGFPQVVLYANTTMLRAIQAWTIGEEIGGGLLIWAANYGNNDGIYNQADADRLAAAYPHPVWMHQFSSTVPVPGFTGRVDGNKMLHPLGEDDMTPQELVALLKATEIEWYDGNKATVFTILTESYLASRGLRGVPAFPGQTDVVQLPPLVSISAAVEGLSDDEARIIAEMRSNNLVLLTAVNAVDGKPSDEQVSEMAAQISEQLGGEYTVTIHRNDAPGDTPRA